ncbi:uncharacterized protein LODBEIA_P03620 [Lodderomyces beijingensis]|uniref:Protein ECM3 n=1 Tax=Lodderomyces beijingensis TaxID=1775926 RepID=A0ABP0ZEX9_9ASCO
MSETSDEVSLGLVIYSAVKPIFKIYFIIGMGYLLAKKNILPVTTCRDISDAVVSAIMPCLIFTNMVSYLKSSDIKSIGILAFTAILLFSSGGIMAYVIHLVTRSPKRWLGGLLSVGIFPNISDLPIAYIQTFSKGTIFTSEEGSKGVAYICIFLMAMVMTQFTFGLFRLVEWDFRDEIKGEAEAAAGAAAGAGAGADDLEKNLTSSSSDDNDENNNNNKSREENTGSQMQMLTRGSSRRSEALTTDSESISSEKSINQRPHASQDEDYQHDQFLKKHSRKSRNEASRREKEGEPPLEPTTNMNVNMNRSASNGGSFSIATTTTTTSKVHRTLTPVSRRRRASVSSAENALNLISSRISDLRSQPPENVEDVINEYSEFDQLRTLEIERSKTSQNEPEIDQKKSKIKRYARAMWTNLLQPNSIALFVSIAVAMSPPLKALFVPTTFSMPNAPDEQPPLSFVIDLTSYVGAASVPLGLLLLGATLSRLQVKKMAPGFWKVALCVTALRLILLPIFGVGVTTGMNNGGWYGSDRLLRFVSVLEFGLPNATVLVYFTAFYTDPNSEEHLQMDCLAMCLIWQYSILWLTLPFLITFTLKVSMGA